MMCSSPGFPPESSPPVIDVSHASSPPSEGAKPAEKPVVEMARTWQVKGPLSFYALHFDRLEADFKKEQERLKKDLARAFALKARCDWLNRLLDHRTEERLPEIDAEWDAVRNLKTLLQVSQSTSRKREVESDARTLLPAWQCPVRVPEYLKTLYNRVQRVMEIQSQLNEDAARRLGEFQNLEQDQKILEAKMLEIEQLERAIGEKIAASRRSTYELNGISSLTTDCSIDKLSHPHAEASFQYIKNKFLGAEKVWSETRKIIEEIRGKLLEWAGLMMVDAQETSAARELYVQANFQRAFAQQQKLQCGRFVEQEFQEKAAFLARFGLMHPEVKNWIDPVQEELEKRLNLAQHCLEILKPVLADFEKEIAGFHKQKERLSSPPSPVPLLEEPKTTPTLLSRLTKKQNKPTGLFVAPAPIDWKKIVSVPVRICSSAVLTPDRNERIRPPLELRRDLSNVPRENWTQLDFWDNCLTAIWPKAMALLNQSLTVLNSSIAGLDLQVFDLQREFKVYTLGQRPWLEAFYWKLRDASCDLSMQRSAYQKEYDQLQAELRSVILLCDSALSSHPPLSHTEPLDAKVSLIQQKMGEAVQDLRVLSAMMQIEWEYGQKAQSIQQGLVAAEPRYSPQGRKAALDQHVEEDDAKSLEKSSRTIFKKVLEANTVLERKALLAAMAFEGYSEEKKKLQQHNLNLKHHVEHLDQLLDQLRMIYANWQHVRNVAGAVSLAKQYLPETSVKLLIMQLMVAFNNVKKDVESYGLLIPEFVKKLEERVVWLDEKLSQDKVEWRMFQERYLLRTPEGNRERNLQIASEIARYHLDINAIKLYWSLGEQNCKQAMASINGLLTKNDEPVQLISENPYLIAKPSPSVPRQAPAPSKVEAKPSEAHHDWFVVKGGEKELDVDVLNLSSPFGFGKPAAQPAVPAAAPEAHAAMILADLDRLESQIDELFAAPKPDERQNGSASPSPIAHLSASLFASGESPASVVKQDE